MSVEEEILKGMLSIIDNIADSDFQKKAWIEKKVHPYACFEETMHHLFDDYEIDEVLNNYKKYNISDEQYNILNKLYEVLDQYSDEKMSWVDSVDPEKIIKDPRWHEIQKLAKEVLKKFNYKRKM